MKAYELKALLATLDDSAEVSIELETEHRPGYRPSLDDRPRTADFDIYSTCGFAPRSAVLRINPEALKIVPHAQERIEELEQQLDELKEKTKDLLHCCVRTGDDTRTDRAMDALEKIL